MKLNISKLHELKITRYVLPVVAALLAFSGLSCQSTGKAPSELQIDLFGTTHAFQLDSKGRLKSEAEISSEDRKFTLTIKKGIKFVDENGDSVYSIQCVIGPSLSRPLQDAQLMGMVYSFSPKGVTCNPPLDITMYYDPQELSPEFTEEEVCITSYEVFICKCGGAYVWYGTANNILDLGNHKVSAQIDTLDNYVLLAAKEGMVVIYTPAVVAK